MSRKIQIPRQQVLSAYDSTINGYSLVTTVGQLDQVSYMIEIDPTVIGTVKFMVNDDKDSDFIASPTPFKELNFQTALTVDGSVDTIYRAQIDVSFKRIRIDWVNNAGLGVINSYVTGHSVGA
jgi:hypothetical protein